MIKFSIKFSKTVWTQLILYEIHGDLNPNATEKVLKEKQMDDFTSR